MGSILVLWPLASDRPPEQGALSLDAQNSGRTRHALFDEKPASGV